MTATEARSPGAAVATLQGTVVAVDVGTLDRDGTEHALHLVAAACPFVVTLACTHFVSEPVSHWAFTLLVQGTVDVADLARPELAGAAVLVRYQDGRISTGGESIWLAGAKSAAEQLLSGSGRVVVFAGQDQLPDRVPVDELASLTAVQQVLGVAGTESAGKTLHTRGFVRPTLVDGQMILHVRPYHDEDGVAPFEVPTPTPCCATHG